MNASVTQHDPYPFEEFAPTLSQCFAIVIVGYLLARLEIFSASDLKGVVAFASYFAMPGIICVSLAEADFRDFRWELLLGIFLGKALVFLTVCGFLFLLDDNLGVAGAVALFCAQSNDLPVGNPLMSSLYKDHRPQMMKYLFLIPALTIVCFMPITNFLMNLHKARRDAGRQLNEHPGFKKSRLQCLQNKELWNQVHAIVTNPVIIATVMGLVLNVIFKGNVPKVLHQPIQVAAATIPGIALAMLGFSFIRKERYLLSSAVVPAAVLLTLKMVVTPILLHAILRMLTNGSKSSKLLSDFSLLYGIISPATAVFQIGQEFRKSLAAMSVALILTSFACFPVSYAVARLTIAPVYKLNSYVPLLKRVLFWTACISIFCDIIVWIFVIWKKHWSKVSRRYILSLSLAQAFTSTGLLIWTLNEKETGTAYFQMPLYYSGELLVYLFTGMLAMRLVCKGKYSLLAEKEAPLPRYLALGISAVVIFTLCVMSRYDDIQKMYVIASPNSEFQYLQLVITTCLLFISTTIVLACLICHFKRSRLSNECTEGCPYGNPVFCIQQQENSEDLSKQEICLKVDNKLGESEDVKLYYDKVVKSSGPAGNLELLSVKRDRMVRISSLLTLQGLTMFVRSISNVFKLVDSKSLEVMIPLEFLQSTLFIGQGVFILLTVGIDVRTPVISLRKWWRKIRRRNDEPTANFTDTDAKGEVARRCGQFYNFYFDRCFKDIARERRWKGAVYRSSFWGHQLVDWMITEGLCVDDADAEGQGQKLLAGGVIEHVTGSCHFYDAPYLYRFVRNRSTMQ